MKLLCCLLLLLSFQVHGEVSSSLSASLVAAKTARPDLYAEVKTRLRQIQQTCARAEFQVKKIKDDQSLVMTYREYAEPRGRAARMKEEITNAIDYEVSKVHEALDVNKSCLQPFFSLSFVTFAEQEGLAYLMSIRGDVQENRFKACSDKLEALLKEAGDE